MTRTYKIGTREHVRSPRLIATQINDKPILRLRDLFGGKFYNAPTRQTQAGNQIFVWEQCGKALVPILDELIPHLVLKQKEAIVLRSFCGLIGNTGRRISDDEISERFAIIKAFELAQERA